jgi:hypothetical protein
MRKILKGGVVALGYGVGYVLGYGAGRYARGQGPQTPPAATVPPPAPAPALDTVRCAVCGGAHVHATAWIDVNTGVLIGGESPTDQLWCDTCKKDISWDELLGAMRA